MIKAEPANHRSAFVFGNEKYGLSNAELQRCHHQIYIPTVPSFSSLNLAAAVQIIAYEIYLAGLSSPDSNTISNIPLKNYATANDLEKLYEHFRKAMIEINFLKPSRPRTMMQRFRQIINRARINKDDLNLLHGMMTAIIAANDIRHHAGER